MMTSERGKQAETVQARRSAHPRPGKRLPAAKLSARAGSWLQRRSTSADEQFSLSGRLADEDLERELVAVVQALTQAIAERAQTMIRSG